MAMEGRRVTYVLRCFPNDDAEFRGAAEAYLATLTRNDVDRGVAKRLADALRPDYPDVVVHRAHQLAEVRGDAILYLYRDGTPAGRDT